MQTKSKKLKASLFLAIAAMLVLSLVLAACGDNTATSTTAPATTKAASTTAAATTAVGTTAAATTAVGTTAASTTAAGTTAAGTAAAAVTPPGGFKIASNVTLSASGASFPNTVYQQWIKDFAVANPTVKLTYNSVGSGAGRKSFFAGEVDFAGTDAYPTDKEVTDYGKKILAIPTTLGAVVLAYNLKDVKELKLTPEVIGAIYTGKITKWNDAKIAADNAGVKLPDLAIVLAVRQDSSGTSDVFSNWLASVSADYKALGIAGSQPTWEKGGVSVVKGPQNDGVAGLVKQTEGALGYIESSYAQANSISYASVKNPAGNFVQADVAAISAAAAGGAVPENLQLKVTNSSDPKAYPIAATTWIIIPQEIADKTKAEAIVKYLWWITSAAAPIEAGKKLGYAPLTAEVVKKLQASLLTVTSGGQPVLK